MNALLEVSNIFNSFGVDALPAIDLNWVAKIISWIFELFTDFHGAVAVGVIVFTLCLKTLVLPLDIYSRVKTKKQSLLMKSMRPQMEKLQHQYANDKQMYQQKVLELQKSHGYNPLGACLPMVVSLVIFMFIFSSFSTYSNYATLQNYNEMVKAYNESVIVYVYDEESENNTDKQFLIASEKGANDYQVDFTKFTSYYSAYCAENNIDFNVEEFNALDENGKWEVVIEFVQIGAQQAVVDWYHDNSQTTEFGWIGNLWYPDSMLDRKIPEYDKFSSSVSRALGAGVSTTYEDSYNEVTRGLTVEKDTYNGYFVLIVLAIGLMFLQQFIMMRAQKDANELSTVDGSGAMNNKWMMIIMPIIFGIFSFMYSAAFSIYMITNTLYSLISTLIINKIVTVRYEKNDGNINSNRPSRNAKRLK